MSHKRIGVHHKRVLYHFIYFLDFTSKCVVSVRAFVREQRLPFPSKVMHKIWTSPSSIQNRQKECVKTEKVARAGRVFYCQNQVPVPVKKKKKLGRKLVVIRD